MEQTVHIFRKDVRRHWPEIVVSIAVLAAFGWNKSTSLMAFEYPADVRTFFLRFLSPLVPVAWAFLVVRVVQEESLVGDRQFWVTRPYEWKKLLAAKLLFVVVFVNVPLLILQVLLLVSAGFPPTPYLAGLLWLQILWTLLLILPAVTLATVTASIGQSTLAVLGALFYLIALAVLSSAIPSAGVSLGSIPDSIGLTMLVVLAAAVILWQYARRATVRSRVLLLGALAAIPLIMLATPYRTLIARAYPETAAREQLPVQLRFDPVQPRSHEGGFPEKNKVHIRIPLLVSGITGGSAVFVAGTLLSIQAPDGLRWNPGWRASGLSLQANRQHAYIDISINKDFFERVKLIPVRVHISFALARVHAREARRIIAKPGGFILPGEGRCSFSPIVPSDTLCLFPLRRPYLLISARFDEITCHPGEGEKPLPAATIGYQWIGGPGAGPAEFGISPIQSDSLSLSDWGKAGGRDFRPPGICPGTPLTIFSRWEKSQRARIELEIEGLRLTDYQLNDSVMGGTGVGIALP